MKRKPYIALFESDFDLGYGTFMARFSLKIVQDFKQAFDNLLS